MTIRLPLLLGVLAAALAAAAIPGSTPATAADEAGCAAAMPTASYLRSVDAALRSRRDAWGRSLLKAPGGPSYERARRFLMPLFLARSAEGKPLTDSGAHYLHFSQPEGPQGATTVALHVADGSQVISRRTHGPRLTIGVGAGGRERFGSCLRRLQGSALADGYLPVLQTVYVDAHGVRYRQESFAARIQETSALVSFVQLTADATLSDVDAVRVRFTPSVSGLARDGDRLVRRGRALLLFEAGASYGTPSVKYVVRRGEVRTVYVAWLNTPSRTAPVTLDEARYLDARASVVGYWQRRLAHGGRIDVPETRVLDAQRNLLVQNLGLTWRYSIGNRYEQLSTPEAIDVARVLGGYGHLQVARAILRTSLRKRPAVAPTASSRSTNWRVGSRLVGFAHYARLTGDVGEIRRATPVLRSYVRRLGRQIDASPRRLLRRERFSSDVAHRVYGLHSQAVVWQGLRSMADVWNEAGYPKLARESARLAGRLEAGLRTAARRSQTRLPGGRLFIPVRLLDGERPYPSLTASRAGSYWNLVVPYALASGLFEPHGPQAQGVLRYLEDHGARLLGLVRAGAYPLYGRTGRPASGANPVYGLNASRFLADNDEADRLVLSLYGQLAAQMTPGTFVSGESVSIAPLGHALRATYLPPNGAANAAFLETLRLMLAHESADRAGRPRGLELAFSTPRPWLAAGKRIEARRMPTSFGRVSFAIEAGVGTAKLSLTVPGRAPLERLRVRLRLPGGQRVSAVLRDGVPYGRVLADGETIELPPVPGAIELEALVG